MNDYSNSGDLPVDNNESTKECAARLAEPCFQSLAALRISEAKSLSQFGPTTLCQPNSSILAVEGVEREMAGHIKCERALALPSISKSDHLEDTASRANSSIQGVFDNSIEGTSGIVAILTLPSSTNISLRAVKTGS